MPRPLADPILHAQAAENFPVASRLLAAPQRAIVLDFYRLVRAADDIADSPSLTQAEKEATLAAIDAALAGVGPAVATPPVAAAQAWRTTCERHALDVEPARQLVQAFLADAANRPCRTWSDLIAYCRFSAVPVGRFLLELHGEPAGSRRAADALCTALQILNHLQDCSRDWKRLRRCYLPATWLAEAGVTTAALAEARSSPDLRRVLDRALDQVEALLREAAPLPAALRDHRLAREAAGIHALARALARRLRRRDPLRDHVALGRLAKAAVFLAAALTLRRGGRRGQGSSFRIAIRLFPAAARRSVAAIHALARRLDDIADGPAPPERKRAALAAWRGEIAALYESRPSDPLTRSLLPAAEALPEGEWLALLDGLECDGIAPLHAPSEAELELYCRRVAGSIGVLVLAACGHRSAADRDYAVALGEALQRVNILRDVAEDAAAGRLYLPRESLGAAGIDHRRPPASVLGDPRLPVARAAFVASIDAAFARAEAAAVASPGARLPAVRVIAAIYRRLFERLRAAPTGRADLTWRDHALAVLAALRSR